MTTQTSLDYISTSDFFSRPLALPNEFFSEAVYSTADEAQLADEMMETLLDNPQNQPLSEAVFYTAIEPDDFEKMYGWSLYG